VTAPPLVGHARGVVEGGAVIRASGPLGGACEGVAVLAWSESGERQGAEDGRRWMPWRHVPMKDAAGGETRRGGASDR